MEQRLRRGNDTCSPDWIHPRLIVVATEKGEESADRLKILGWHNVLIMIPETNWGPNAITNHKQTTVMTAALKWLYGYVIGSVFGSFYSAVVWEVGAKVGSDFWVGAC